MAEYPEKIQNVCRMADAAQAGKAESLDDLYNRVMKGSAGSPVPAFANRGVVGLMRLPEGWKEGPSLSGVRGSDYFVSFHAPDSEKTVVSLSYDGYKHDSSTAEQFTLSVDNRRPSRQSELSSGERSALATVLGSRMDPAIYKIDLLGVEKLDGRNVLVLHGKYLDNGIRETAVFVDADGKGASIQVIAMQAPDDEFAKYEPQFKEMLKDLRWSR